jgi:glycosyltransferase involved in cell wall biosynthesis
VHLESARERFPNFPKVVVLYEELSDSQMRALYQQCDTLVAPSRAEGFGLPIAEAILSGTPAITTGWSGQLDFCETPGVDLIDFRFMQATSHLQLTDSVWAEPDTAHLTDLLKRYFALSKEERAVKVETAKTKLLADYRWSDVATRQVAAARNFVTRPCFESPNIAWVSTYKQRCGIATYSEHLLQVLDLPATVLAPRISSVKDDPANVIRCWLDGCDDTLSELQNVISDRHFDIVIIQFNYGFFDFSHFSALLCDLFHKGIQVIVFLHSTADPEHDQSKRLIDLQSVLRRCDRLFVHSIHDMNRLKNLGLSENVTLLPHGVLSPKLPIQQKFRQKTRLIATYGFFLPNKGIAELVQAIHILRQRGMDYHLRLINAEYPVNASHALIAQIKDLVRRLNLEAVVEFHTDFLADHRSLELISSADVVVYPYQKTGESASGAVRYGLASGLPVAVTPLSIFDDLSDAVFRLPGISADDVANGLSSIFDSVDTKDNRYRDTMARAARWRAENSYTRVGHRLSGLLLGLFRDKFYDKQRASTGEDHSVAASANP